MAELVAQLRAAYPNASEQEIAEIITRLGNERGRLERAGAQAGYTPAGMTNERLFSPGFESSVSLLTGQNEIDREERLLEAAARAQQDRATTGLGLLADTRARANDIVDLQGDPGNIVKYLAGVAGLPEGGNPVQSLLGAGFKIDPVLPSPYADPKYQALQGSLMDFAQPRTVQQTAVESQRNAETSARAQYGDEAIDRIAQANKDGATMEGYRRLAGLARGGSMMVNEPTVGIGAFSGQPQFTLAENGPEKIAPGAGGMSVTPQPGVSQQLDPAQQMAMIQNVMPSRAVEDVKAAVYRTPLGRVQNPYTPPYRGIQGFAVPGYAAGTDIYHPRTQKGSEPVSRSALSSSSFKRGLGNITTTGPRIAKLYEDWGGPGFQNTPLPVAADAPASALWEKGWTSPAEQRAGTPSASTPTGWGALPPKDPNAPPVNPNMLIGGPYRPGQMQTQPVGTPQLVSPGYGIAPEAEMQTLPAGNVTPLQGAAMGLGKALQRNPFADREMVRMLLMGQAPPPGLITQRFRANADGSLLAVLDAIVKASGFSPEDYAASARRFNVPGANTYGVSYR